MKPEPELAANHSLVILPCGFSPLGGICGVTRARDYGCDAIRYESVGEWEREGGERLHAVIIIAPEK